MEKHIEDILRKISFGAITVATFTLVMMILRTPGTCIVEKKPMVKFPKSSCDSSHRQHLPLEKKNQRLWSSKSWNQQVRAHMLHFQQLQRLNLVFNHSKVLCVSAGAGHEVMALNRLGVADVTGVELMDSLPLVSRADPHNLPFFDEVFDLAFTAHLTEALFPSRFASEMERTVKNDGLCVVLVEQCGVQELKEIVGLFRKSRLIDAVNVTFIGSNVTRILMRTTRVSA